MQGKVWEVSEPDLEGIEYEVVVSYPYPQADA
jgi:hypothetical protein